MKDTGHDMTAQTRWAARAVFAVLLFACGTVFSDTVSDKYGYPCTNAVQVLERPAYSLGYSPLHNQPLWVQYRLNGLDFTTNKVVKRSNDFREDNEVRGGSATLDDYRASGYDRGHLAPAADFSYSPKRMSESFLLSNMSPQAPAFNRGVWKDLEAWVRDAAKRNGRIVIVTGGVFPSECVKWTCIGRRKMVTVPQRYFKVLLDEREPKKAIGFLLENAGTTNAIATFACSVDDVERVTGLDFFSAMDDKDEEAVEGAFDFSQW